MPYSVLCTRFVLYFTALTWIILHSPHVPPHEESAVFSQYSTLLMWGGTWGECSIIHLSAVKYNTKLSKIKWHPRSVVKVVIFVKIEFWLLFKRKLWSKIVWNDDCPLNLTWKISLKNIWNFRKYSTLAKCEKIPKTNLKKCPKSPFQKVKYFKKYHALINWPKLNLNQNNTTRHNYVTKDYKILATLINN